VQWQRSHPHPFSASIAHCCRHAGVACCALNVLSLRVICQHLRKCAAASCSAGDGDLVNGGRGATRPPLMTQPDAKAPCTLRYADLPHLRRPRCSLAPAALPITRSRPRWEARATSRGGHVWQWCARWDEERMGRRTVPLVYSTKGVRMARVCTRPASWAATAALRSACHLVRDPNSWAPSTAPS